MGKVLYILANPKGIEESYSQRVGQAFLQSYLELCPSDEVITLDLYNMEIPYIDQKVFLAWSKLINNELMSAEETELVDYIDDMIEQFISVDRYIVVCPMWNYLFPAKLKTYLDIVCFAGKKYKNYANGTVDILSGKKAILIQSRGADYKSEEMKHKDFATSYLQTIFSMLGLTQFRAIHIEGVVLNPNKAQEMESKAIKRANEDARWFANE